MNTLFNRQNLFLILLILMVIAGKLIPYKPHYNEIFNLNKFIDWGIAGIFLLYGLKLNLKEVVKDISNWKLHLLVQFGTFILFPMLVFLFYPLAKGNTWFPLWVAVFFLAALPSTVSSSVVMVSIAKGNITSAIFNASVSGLIGIVMTPLLMSFFLSQNAESGAHSTEIIAQLLIKVLLPIILGILLNPIFRNLVNRHSKLIGEFDRLIILLIVYESFSGAFINRIFSTIPTIQFIWLTLACIALFFIVYEIIKFICHRLNFSREDTVTATFCGSKKSLVHGSLFVLVLGIPDESKVLFLLPIMIYHSFQLFYVSWLANKLAKSV
ncbi:bile acid:sodium symporter [Chryseobacterium taklimakanense]|uniref:Bile acid:sodium symporter n=1 Tax=Chryseobacterium taklimakanense TaxID=536441 RepID=A0A3G8WHB2_9FLAO|nr:bile acid:sodium symporter [Chryseobacterium taklimakanense]AZI20572.1 bile acid:sodium symporter [Chryseobacterium taklimakanense]